MRELTIDPERMKAVQEAAARERAAHGSCSAQLHDAMSAEAEIARQIQAGRRRATSSQDVRASNQATRLETEQRKARSAVVEASAQLEDAKDRLSSAIRLRNACEAYVHGR